MRTTIYKTIVFAAVLLFSCQDDLLNSNNSDEKNQLLNKTSGCTDIIIDYESFENAVIEDYTIDSASLEDDSLVIEVSYGGGCGTTNFNLVTHGYFMESYPVQLVIILDIEDNDPCEALISETICFDLTELANHYNQAYLTDSGSIIIHLEEYDEGLIYEF